MRAAIVEAFDRPPRFATFPEPEPAAGEVLITVVAAPLSNLVKGQASGRHYSSGHQLPFIPGNDGVGRTPAGQRVYFLAPRAPFGSMAERTVVKRDRILSLPDNLDDIAAAAIGNPGIASWGALLGRARLQPGEAVLVNGATGVSGRQAVQVARYLGARRIVATGRDPRALQELRALGADAIIDLQQTDEALSAAFQKALCEDGGTQVVLDFLYGHSAELLLQAGAGHGSAQGEPRIRFIQIGSASGGTIQLSAEWLRSSGIELLGSGLGSLSADAILGALRTMYDAWSKGGLRVDTQAIPLEQVEVAWTKTEGGRRTVFTL